MEKKFKKLTGVVPLEIAEVGDYVQFGKIAWAVIAIEGDKKLLLSKEWMQIDYDETCSEEDVDEPIDDLEDDLENDLVDNKLAFLCSEAYFNRKYRACQSDYERIQKYLRESFCEEYFLQSDLKRIVPYSIEINDQTVSEQVFLLSRDEVEKYIPKKEDRIAYAVIDFDILVSNVKKPWLLRFNESERYYFVVDKEGEIIVASWYYDGYRPAVWVK